MLNTTYEPINICTVKRAIILIFKGSATMIEEDSDYVHSISTKIKMLLVIKLNRYIKIPQKPVEKWMKMGTEGVFIYIGMGTGDGFIYAKFFKFLYIWSFL